MFSSWWRGFEKMRNKNRRDSWRNRRTPGGGRGNQPARSRGQPRGRDPDAVFEKTYGMCTNIWIVYWKYKGLWRGILYSSDGYDIYKKYSRLTLKPCHTSVASLQRSQSVKNCISPRCELCSRQQRCARCVRVVYVKE